MHRQINEFLIKIQNKILNKSISYRVPFFQLKFSHHLLREEIKIKCEFKL